MKAQLVGVVWWPHSGGRWLCRSLIKNNSKVHETAFTHPWLFFTTDMTLDLDITAQVHKARSLPELKDHLQALQSSTDAGRIHGLKTYFEYIENNYIKDNNGPSHILGEMCLGSPIPRYLDIEALFKANSEFKLIHLIRSPLESFPSFANRYEMDSDPVKIAGSWLAQNAAIRKFFELNPEFKNQYYPVRYEDLMKDLKNQTQKICDFMAIPFEEEMLTKAEERWGRNTRSQISEEVKDSIIEIAQVDLKRYNYID